MNPLETHLQADIRPTERRLLRALREHGIDHVVTVPCSITATWHSLLTGADRAGAVRQIVTGHEGNLPGIAAGLWLGTGRPALVHMQNSGLPNAADGFISLASEDVCGVPMVAVVTWRGDTPDDDSEPHQAIGRRTPALCDAVFGPANVFGRRDGAGLLQALDAAVARARTGRPVALRVASTALQKAHGLHLPGPAGAAAALDLAALRAEKGEASLPAALSGGAALSRDEALAAIVAEHPGAAILFSNGFTARAAQAVADRPGNFYNTGYMGGTLAMGWGLAVSRPDLAVVVVDGDQNAVMSGMKEHLLADYPPNLFWYVLDNGIGASVGTAASVPLSPLCRQLARVVATVPDAPGSFRHPRVSTTGAYAAEAARQAPGALTGLARGLRRWIEQQPGVRHDHAQA
jgi:phosphonopyruvate decarboxylase